jgi:ribosome maturation factor RimP
MANSGTHTKERELQRQITVEVERSVPGIEVLAVELLSPTRFCVYVDHPQGVDHALCGTVTDLLRGYLEQYTVDVSSPGLERPLRKPAHFRNAVGRRVQLRTEGDFAGRRRPRPGRRGGRAFVPPADRGSRSGHPVRRRRAGQSDRRGVAQ